MFEIKNDKIYNNYRLNLLLTLNLEFPSIELSFVWLMVALALSFTLFTKTFHDLVSLFTSGLSMNDFSS